MLGSEYNGKAPLSRILHASVTSSFHRFFLQTLSVRQSSRLHGGEAADVRLLGRNAVEIWATMVAFAAVSTISTESTVSTVSTVSTGVRNGA
jgi:hypothetical protein